MKVALKIEYRGDAFCGWQRQENGLSVQESVEDAIGVFLRASAKKERVEIDRFPHIVGSGRTDSGVHAYAQVATFFWPQNISFNPLKLKSALNGILPQGVVVTDLTVCDESFDARRCAHEKCYRYDFLLRDIRAVLSRGRAWRVETSLNVEQMIAAAHLFKGQHDFDSFRALNCGAANSVRLITRSELVRLNAERMSYYVCGKGFLKQMVRIIAGTLVAVGRGEKTVQDIEDLLYNPATRSRVKAGQTAPAYGLHLMWVKY